MEKRKDETWKITSPIHFNMAVGDTLEIKTKKPSVKTEMLDSTLVKDVILFPNIAPYKTQKYQGDLYDAYGRKIKIINIESAKEDLSKGVYLIKPEDK